jgi:hypothetical protein
MADLDIFIEQAEYIPLHSFEKWTIKHHDESMIIKKLSQGGAKLITGPRGSGKTTLMLKTYNRLCEEKSSSAFPVYVNFKSSLKLEPLYKESANATYWFNQWLLFKVVEGIHSTIEQIHIIPNATILPSKAKVQKIISLLEMGRSDLLDESEDQLTLFDIEQIIGGMLNISEKKRCVLLLDDAAHAFSSEQQQDFFEFFRKIKTKSISPKAAIYPGVTNYSSSFHVGHDAEEIDVWTKPSSSGYLDFMTSILDSRLPKEIFQEIRRDKALLELVCFASYGIPRSLLNIISILYKDDEDLDSGGSQIDFTSKNVIKAIKKCFDDTYQIYDSLRLKLPIYEQFIDVGTGFFEKCIVLLKKFNKSGEFDKQSSIIGIKRPVSSELSKVIGFFQYAGLLLPVGLSSRGGKGVYELYELHYSALINRNVFFSRQTISAADYVTAFKNRPNHHYPRHTTEGLMEADNVSSLFVLSLPPCHVCKTPRISNEAKFCASCGAKLNDVSVFESIINQEIDKLPITERRASSIRENSRIRFIKDILMDHDNSELRSVPMIGPAWSRKIRSYAEEYIA